MFAPAPNPPTDVADVAIALLLSDREHPSNQSLEADTIDPCPQRGLSWSSLRESMELSFRTQRLRTLCEEHDAAVSAIGEPAAEVLQTRIADLRAATYLSDLPAGRPAVVEGNRPQLQFELRDGRFLLMMVGAGNQRVPRTTEGKLDPTRVRRALVQDVG